MAKKSTAESIDDARIMRLFRGRCVMCMSPATEVNEIILRSRTKRATTMKNNRVPLCHTCHTAGDRSYHSGGVTQEKMDFMFNKAVERLIMWDEKISDW